MNALDTLNKILDRLRLASLLTIIGAIVGGVLVIDGELDFNEYLTSLGILAGGAGLLGVARTQAGHGNKP